jgi:hypothetical protein
MPFDFIMREQAVKPKAAAIFFHPLNCAFSSLGIAICNNTISYLSFPQFIATLMLPLPFL